MAHDSSSTVGAAAVFLMLYISGCEALPSDGGMFDSLLLVGEFGRGGSELEVLNASSASPPPPHLDVTEGVRYRPPIVNMHNFGGPVMWKPIHVYFIWYGNWTEPEKNVLRTATNSLTPNKRIHKYPNLSNLWSIVTEYYQEPQHPGDNHKQATNSVTIKKEIHDHYSFGKNFTTDNHPLTIILSHVGKDLPTDLEQGIYFLFTSGDVTFTSDGSYCGYHNADCVDPTRNGTSFCNDEKNHIIYSFVPLSSTENGLKQSRCNVFNLTEPGVIPAFGIQGPPPNHQVSPDGALNCMVTVYLHELLETAVDPYFSTKPAWIFNISENSETADLCSYDYVAGDWWYCYLQSIYSDFPGVDDIRCHSLRTNHGALMEPKSHTTFNIYGLDGSEFLVQLMWSLENRGCASQPEEACPSRTVVMHKTMGTIQRGIFFEGVGLQTYAPGQNCSWKILVPGAKCIRLYFEKVALGFDDLDYVTVSAYNNVIKRKVTRFGKNIKVKVSGDEAPFRFVTYGGRSPYPSSAGFIMHYEAATEPVIIASNRQLSKLHPIYQLMAPHFKCTLEFNRQARSSLIAAGGSIEQHFTTRAYSMEMAGAHYRDTWTFETQALPNDLIRRGMAVPDPSAKHGVKLVVEDYPYAADGLELWDAIKSWNTEYVDIFYKTDAEIPSDVELMEWWTEIRTKAHADKKDAPGWPELNSKQALVEILTTLQWIASAQHAAVNFGQYDFVAYMPHHPTVTRRLVPEEGTKEWEEFQRNPEKFFLSIISSISSTTTAMSVYEVLSAHSPNEEYIGQRDPHWTECETVKAAFKRFCGKLAELDRSITARNDDPKLKNRLGVVEMPYQLLRPHSNPGVTAMGVPNSITI